MRTAAPRLLVSHHEPSRIDDDDKNGLPPMMLDRTEHAPTRADGPSIHVVRARKLLFGGLVGGLVATVLCLVGFGIGAGLPGLVSAAAAAAMVLFFYSVGQLVMVRFADAGARTLLSVAMASYTARVVVLGLLLLLYNQNAERWSGMVPMAVFVTTMAVVAGWLLVEVFVFSRLRIGAYDAEYVPPADDETQQ